MSTSAILDVAIHMGSLVSMVSWLDLPKVLFAVCRGPVLRFSVCSLDHIRQG